MVGNNKGNIKSIILVLYIIAFVMGMYTLFTIYNSHVYISNLVNTKGLVVSNELANVISYYMNASMPYVFYTIVIWGIGNIISRLDSIKSYEVNMKGYKSNEEEKSIENDINLNDEEQELDLFVNTLGVSKNKL